MLDLWRANNLSKFFPILKITAPLLLTVDIDTNAIQRNGKNFIQVKSVKVKILYENFVTVVYSKSLSRFTNGLLNYALNNYFLFVPDFENYVAFILSSILELIVEKIAIEDIFEK